VSGCTIERYIDRTISVAKTESVRIPNGTDRRPGLDFSNDKITEAAMNEDAIEAIVMKGVNNLR